ncbi:MAG: hypothetical protein ACJAXS_001632 [Colwellia sp.]|jgi:hypothetical protein
MTKYYSYKDLEERYNRNRKSIWRWWAKEGVLTPPKKVRGKLLGWTYDDLLAFESGQAPLVEGA